MARDQRIVLFIVVLLLLLTGFVVFENPKAVTGNRGLVILAVLMLLSFTLITVQHFFTRPTDVVISSVSILLLLSTVHQSLDDEHFVWFWALAAYNAFVLIMAMLSTTRPEYERALSADFNNSALSLKRITITLGNKILLWLALMVLCAYIYYENHSVLVLALAIYALVIVLLNILKLFPTPQSLEPVAAVAVAPTPSPLPAPSPNPQPISNITSERVTDPVEVNTPAKVDVPGVPDVSRGIAVIIQIQSSNTLVAQMLEEHRTPSRFDMLGMLMVIDGDEQWLTGLMLDSYKEGNATCIRIMLDDSLAELSLKTQRIKNAKPGDVYPLTSRHALYLFENLAGTVGEKRTPEKMQFVAAPALSVEQGELLNIKDEETEVFYQVLYPPARSSNSEHVVPMGLAEQLGRWDESIQRFEKTDRLPAVNSPVYKVEEIVTTPPSSPEYSMGKIPGTNYPGIINCETAMLHHLAVLGEAGTGKSSFVENLITQLQSETSKVICFDCDRSSRNDLDNGTAPLVSEAFQLKLNDAVDAMCMVLNRQSALQDREEVLLQETILRGGFMAAVTEFLKGDARLSRFVMPEFSDPSGSLQYTRWFFNALFELASSKKFGSVRVCLLLNGLSDMFNRILTPGISVDDSNQIAASILRLAQRGNQYGLGLIVVDDELTDVSEAVIRQCQSVVVFRQRSVSHRDYFSGVLGEGFMSVLTHLQPGHAITAGRAFNSGTPVMLEIS